MDTDTVVEAIIVGEDDKKYEPKNIRMFRFVGTFWGGAAIALAGWLLVAPYKTEIVDRTVDVNGQEATVQISRDVIAWGQDALLGAAAPAALLIVIAVAFAMAKNIGTVNQRVFTLLAAFAAGGFICPWAYDRIMDADFVASEAWRGFWSALAVVAALVLSHLYYWGYKKSS